MIGEAKMNTAAQDRRAFTMIELMVVIVIIAILATAGTFLVRNVMITARIKETQATLSRVESACEEFKGDQGRYPLEELDSSMWTAFNLYGRLTNPAFGGPYLEAQIEDFCEADGSGNVRIVDGWGQDVTYEVIMRNASESRGVRITSVGPDGQLGTADDLVSTKN
jgi:general secretion pathway protein G